MISDMHEIIRERDQYKAERDQYKAERDTLIDDLVWYKAKVNRLEQEGK